MYQTKHPYKFYQQTWRRLLLPCRYCAVANTWEIHVMSLMETFALCFQAARFHLTTFFLQRIHSADKQLLGSVLYWVFILIKCHLVTVKYYFGFIVL